MDEIKMNSPFVCRILEKVIKLWSIKKFGEEIDISFRSLEIDSDKENYNIAVNANIRLPKKLVHRIITEEYLNK